MLGLTLAATAASSGCRGMSPATAPASGTIVVVSIQGLDCSSCGEEIAELLVEEEAIGSAIFDRKQAQVEIAYDPAQISPDAILAKVEAHEEGHAAVLGAGQGSYVAAVEFAAELNAATISKNGESVRLRDHIEEGQVTVVDFYAPWCKPCREIDHHMKSVLREHDDVALRKVNIVDWDSAAAQQHLVGVPELPYLIVYGTNGRKVAKIHGLDLAALDAAIDKGRR